jgi:hypothetical protein
MELHHSLVMVRWLVFVGLFSAVSNVRDDLPNVIGKEEEARHFMYVEKEQQRLQHARL